MVAQPTKLVAFRLAFLLSFLFALPAPVLRAQSGPRIAHDEVKCILAGQHLILQARIEPIDDLMTVKVYFRANPYPQFYYVEMTRVGDVYQGVLPKPSPEIDGIHYYLEAMDATFNSVRTGEYTPQVTTDESRCRERNPTPAMYLDGPGAITVGATGAGPALPTGFLPDGIVGTVTAAGRAASGGGSSALLIGGLAAGGAAAAAGILVGGNDSSGTTTTVPGGPPTSVTTTSIPPATTSAPAAGPIVACFDTSPSPPTIPVGGSVRFDASCTQPSRDQIASYRWEFNDGRGGREGRVVNRTYNTPGTFPAELTVTDLNGNRDSVRQNVTVRETSAGPGPAPGPTTTVSSSTTTTVPPTADIQVSLSGPGTRTVGTKATYVIRVLNNGPLAANGVTFNSSIAGSFINYSGAVTGGFSSCTFTPPTVNCSNATMAPGSFFEITVSVDPNASGNLTVTASATSTSPPDPVPNNSRTIVTTVPLKAPNGSPRRVVSRFTSHLQLPPGDGRTKARVAMNGARTDVTDNAEPFVHRVMGRTGDNTVAAFVLGNPRQEGVWRFDFRNAPGFEASSFVVEAGQLLSQQARQIVFRVRPGAQRVRFRYRLSGQP